jgi:cell wall-associated NlpC family hydrolase
MDDLERDQRARVVALAREWIGTPYRNQARVKGIGADCTFFAVVYEEAGLIPTARRRTFTGRPAFI